MFYPFYYNEEYKVSELVKLINLKSEEDIKKYEMAENMDEIDQT